MIHNVERTRQFYGQVVSCLTKVTKSVWACLLLYVTDYSRARVRFPVHKANHEIVVNTQFLWSRSTCKYPVQSYFLIVRGCFCERVSVDARHLGRHSCIIAWRNLSWRMDSCAHTLASLHPSR